MRRRPSQIIAVCGGSGSGKSTLARKFVGAAVLATDSFYKDVDDLTPKEDGTFDFDHPDAVNLEEAAEEYFEDGQVLLAESTGDEILATTEMPENLSDWEQAICNVSDGKARSAGQKGPSMITVIVAVVGMIVVIGAYMKK